MMTYAKFTEIVKNWPQGILKEYIDQHYSFNKGVNAGTWGGCTTYKIVEGDVSNGVVEQHTQSTSPRVHGPNVHTDFKLRHKLLNGYMIPSEDRFNALVRVWKSYGSLTSVRVYAIGIHFEFGEGITNDGKKWNSFEAKGGLKDSCEKMFQEIGGLSWSQYISTLSDPDRKLIVNGAEKPRSAFGDMPPVTESEYELKQSRFKELRADAMQLPIWVRVCQTMNITEETQWFDFVMSQK